MRLASELKHLMGSKPKVVVSYQSSQLCVLVANLTATEIFIDKHLFSATMGFDTVFLDCLFVAMMAETGGLNLPIFGLKAIPRFVTQYGREVILRKSRKRLSFTRSQSWINFEGLLLRLASEQSVLDLADRIRLTLTRRKTEKNMLLVSLLLSWLHLSNVL